MRPVSPRIEGLDEIMVAEDQHDYKPLAAALQPHTDGSTSRVCRWTFSDEERAAIARGEDLYFLTPAWCPLVPHSFKVGYP
jgi:hypothetical protein